MAKKQKSGILSALSAAAVLVCSPLSAETTPYDLFVIVTGKVIEGHDDTYTDVMGKAPPQHVDFAGKKFTLTYVINDGLGASDRTNNPLYTSIEGDSGTTQEIGSTPVQTATLTIDGTSITLGDPSERIDHVSSYISRNINGSATEDIGMDESFSVPGWSGQANATMTLDLGSTIKPPLKPDYAEPIYFVLPSSGAASGNFEYERVETQDGFEVPGTKRDVSALLLPLTVNINRVANAKYTQQDKQNAAKAGYGLGLAAQSVGWMPVMKGGAAELAREIFKTILAHVMQGDLGLN